jgi:tetratricopeptide (TPR) repeat protein
VIRFALMAMLFMVQQPETMSLLGEPLYAPSLQKDERKKAEAEWTAAYAAYKEKPSDAAAVLALGRANLTLGRVGDALEVLTRGLEAKPDDPALLAARGRGYTLIRKFPLAERDLRKAAPTIPPARCGLALALYLQADFAGARDAYKSCENPGPLAALADRRAAAPPAAATRATAPAAATTPPVRFPGTAPAPRPKDADASRDSRYAEAIDRLLAGEVDTAREQLKKIVEKDRKHGWMDEIYIAAEADYARLYKPERRKKKL